MWICYKLESLRLAGGVAPVVPANRADDVGKFGEGEDDARVRSPRTPQVHDGRSRSCHLAIHERVAGILVGAQPLLGSQGAACRWEHLQFTILQRRKRKSVIVLNCTWSWLIFFPIAKNLMIFETWVGAASKSFWACTITLIVLSSVGPFFIFLEIYHFGYLLRELHNFQYHSGLYALQNCPKYRINVV